MFNGFYIQKSRLRRLFFLKLLPFQVIFRAISKKPLKRNYYIKANIRNYQPALFSFLADLKTLL